MITQPHTEPCPSEKHKMVHSKIMAKLLTLLLVCGPGLIVMVADNDAGAVSTYTQAGAQYGTKLLWLLLCLLPVTYFIQEMVARLGIATGQGHAAMIYKRFGKWWGIFSLFDLQLVNFLTLVTEFAAINLAAAEMGISPYLAVPLAAVGLILVVTCCKYRRWERIMIFLCAIDLAWIPLAIRSHITGHALIHAALLPSLPIGGITSSFVFLVIAIVGTTIAPWQLFFQQSCVADKRLRFSDLPWERLETFIGAVVIVAMAGCMMLVGTLFCQQVLLHGGNAIVAIQNFTPAVMAHYLGQYFGPWMKDLVLLLMVNASLLGAATISLASAWAYGEVKGWPSSLEMNLKDAFGFYAIYAAAVSLAAGLVLIPRAPLNLIILGVQVLAGVMLPSTIVFLQLLLNDKELLGIQFANKPWNNWVNWTIIIILFLLSMILAMQVMLPNLIK